MKKGHRRPQYYRDVTIMVTFQSGVAIIRFGLYGGYLSISSTHMRPERVKQEMKNLLTGWEFRDRLPSTFPKGWRGVGTYFRKQTKDNEWWVFSRPFRQGGHLPSFSREGSLVGYYIEEGIGIEIGHEIPFQYEEGASRTIETFRYSGTTRSPKWFDTFMVEIVAKLFEGERVCAISADPYTFETIYTRREAETCKGFHLVAVCPVIYLSNGRVKHVWKERTVDAPNHKNGTFLFSIGENVYGVMADREGYGYLLPYTFHKIQSYLEGLPVDQLASEIERIRFI